MHKYLITKLKKHTLFVCTTFILLIILTSNSFTKEKSIFSNIVEVEGSIKVNFSRDKYIEKAFEDSFELLMSKIVLSRDIQKIKNIKLKQIKDLISSFQIIEENYRNDKYKGKLQIFYNEIKVRESIKDMYQNIGRLKQNKYRLQKCIPLKLPDSNKEIQFKYGFIYSRIK